MKIGLFGGTFDPIHSGHLSAARAARERFGLERIYFVPGGSPPHKSRHAPFEHRLAMVALACAGERSFIPSAMEAPAPGKRNYSILTVRRFRRELGDSAELFFLIGADAFLSIRSWQQWKALLNSTNFIVISRPGFDLARVETILPGPWKRRGTPLERRGLEYRLARTSIFVVYGVWASISATDIRAALAPQAARGRGSADQKLPFAVAEYVRKTGLYAGGIR